MQAIEKLIEQALDNYNQIALGKRSIAKGKVLNESANIVIKLTLLQMNHLAKEKISLDK
jgi:hypothetical protein